MNVLAKLLNLEVEAVSSFTAWLLCHRIVNNVQIANIFRPAWLIERSSESVRVMLVQLSEDEFYKDVGPWMDRKSQTNPLCGHEREHMTNTRIFRCSSYGLAAIMHRKASAILNLEAWFSSENLRRLHQWKSLRSHGFSLLYSRRYQPSLHSWSKDRMWSKAFDSSRQRRWFSSWNRIEWTIRWEDRTLRCRSFMLTGD